ncbi:hypothetical protein ACFOHT_04740 [Massilia oculi]|uniref:Uncharacterized protein n=1 Tax=Massilia oculi TaxID=945844 RepID=A0A2S2DDF8_9BURK|nr:hypothetical protein [Massilia oculi]AWL03380.1 hypothetical protein DIR46_02210 [Massilia oculi]
MPKFVKLEQWRFDPNSGDVDTRLKDVGGNIYDASFKREMVPELLVRMHQMLSGTIDQFPEGLKELTEAYIPLDASLQILPNSDLAIFLLTQTGMQVPIHLELKLCDRLLELLGEARTTLLAEQAATQSGLRQ